MTGHVWISGALAFERSRIPVLIAMAGAMLSSCATTPDRIAELETAKAAVAQVEASPRAGLAATYVAEARKALGRATALAEQGGSHDDVRYEANVASLNAQIANEKILAAEAREAIEEGKAERQAVLIEARERESERRAEQAQRATQEALLARQRTESLERELADLKARKTERGVVVTLGDVLFDTDRATLKPGAYGTIERLATVLKERPERSVLIEGHTDSVGSGLYNQTLSERRAASVQAALLERGVSPSRITTTGRGEDVPVASNADPGGRQQNRRVELILQEGSGGGPGQNQD